MTQAGLSSLSVESPWGRLVARVVEAWPEHRDFLEKSVSGCDEGVRETAQNSAAAIERLSADGLTPLLEGYRWMCEMVLEEELHFRRNGSYRYSRFEDAYREVYANGERMSKYMAGLLLSQVLWSNHLRVFDFYTRSFVAELAASARHLEVGPGHGLLLERVAAHGVQALSGWDVSETSLAHTARCLQRLGVAQPVQLRSRNIFEPLLADERGSFDSIVISEVLEHLEEPGRALRALKELAAPGAKLFINAPVNSPALDHIYLFRAPEEVVALVEQSGFRVEQTLFAPASGYSEARARKLAIAISAAVVATPT